MQTITYDHRREERESWGDGPWVNEPDKVQWQDEATGLPCLVVRNALGAWCGYVGVPEGHPCFEKDPSEVHGHNGFDRNDNYVERDKPIVDVLVHGGLTFSGFCAPDDKEHGICHIVEPGENDRVWWLGFDCAQYTDIAPKYEAEFGRLPSHFDRSYKTLEYVQNQTRALALQLAAVVT